MKRRIGVPLLVATGLIGAATLVHQMKRGAPTGAAIGLLVDVTPDDIVMVERLDAGLTADVVPDRWLVRLSDRSPEQLLDALAGPNTGLVRVSRRIDALDIVELTISDRALVPVLESLSGVAWVEPVAVVRAAGAPNDPYYVHQWNLDMMGMTRIYASATADDVVVAVLDTGVSAQLDGLNSLMQGYDFVDDDTDASDGSWHGTHVAGTIAQSTNNEVGVASVAPDARILPVRVLDDGGSGNATNLAEGIVWAVDAGADVINLSLGLTGFSDAVADACAYAEDSGVVVIAATGNDGATDGVQYPAALDTVLAVGAVDLNGDVAGYSNRGEEVDVVAPGGDLDADLDGNGLKDGVLQAAYYGGEWQYIGGEGTSMAAPHVSALAALLVGAGVSSPAQIRDILTSTAEDLGATGHDSASGYGLIDPEAALLAGGVSPDLMDDRSAEGGGGGGGVGAAPSGRSGSSGLPASSGSGCAG